MATKTRPWTRAELVRLPDDGNRYEVLHGDLLVTPLPSIPHQAVALMLGGLISAYCRRHGVGFASAPGAVPNGDNELQPDIAVFLGVGMRDAAKWEDLPLPTLVVEVLSPATQRRDLVSKRTAYLRWGIPEYWIVDTEKRQVTAIRPGGDDERVTDTLRWQPRPDVPALEIKLDELFR
ncbi:MAG: Uma2 family endonuclease [Gemmatimonadaceae bacterium]